MMSQFEIFFVCVEHSLDGTLQLRVHKQNLQWSLVRGPSKQLEIKLVGNLLRGQEIGSCSYENFT